MVMAKEGSPNCEKGCTSKECISNDYMILEPNEVSFLDLIRFLFHKDIEKWKFVLTKSSTKVKSCQEKYRGIIFICLLIQKVLQFVSVPLMWAGSKIEMWLNICSHNENIFGVFRNLFAGKLIVPERNSETYFSFIGCLDKRMELDQRIKYGDPKYFSSLAVMASKLSYENPSFIENTVTNVWKMEFVEFFDFWNDHQQKRTTQAFIFRNKNVDPEVTVVSFRGTEAFDADAWCTDLDISWIDLNKIIGKKAKVHCGFMKALGLKKCLGWPETITDDLPDNNKLAYYELRRILRNILNENENGRFIVTGHSLGGALAVLFPAILHHHKEEQLLNKMEGVYTFGQPRVGDKDFGNIMTNIFKKHDICYYRFVYGNDIVPRLPYDNSTLTFKHFGDRCIFIDESYEGEVLDEQPNKNYYSRKWMWHKIMVACKELIRSFTIRREKGEDFKEGWTLRFIRMVGLVFPGFSAHSLQDYDNSIRLASNDLFVSAGCVCDDKCKIL